MKLNSFLGPARDDDASDRSASILGRGHRITRSAPPGRTTPSGKTARSQRMPEPPPIGDDLVSVSLEATYLMVGDKYDPNYLSPNDLTDMLDLMKAGGAVGHSEKGLLLQGPNGRGYPLGEYSIPRNIINEWQNALARAVGQANLAGVSRATRALGILGRVAVTRLPQ